MTQPLEFGSHKSKLVHALRIGPCSHRVKLTGQQWLALVTWIDANAPYHDNFIKKRTEKPVYDMPADQGLIDKVTAVHARRCQSCHDPAEVSRGHWIDLWNPRESLFLAAPLAKSAGGLQRCSQAVYRSQDDRDFQTLAKLVEDAVRHAWESPRRDLRSLVRTAVTDP